MGLHLSIPRGFLKPTVHSSIIIDLLAEASLLDSVKKDYEETISKCSKLSQENVSIFRAASGCPQDQHEVSKQLKQPHSIFIAFKLFRRAWSIFVLGKYILTPLYFSLIDLFEPAMAHHCYLIGRSNLGGTDLEVLLPVVNAVSYNVWYLASRVRCYKLNIFQFCLIDDNALEAFYRKLGGRREFSLVSNMSGLSSADTNVDALEIYSPGEFFILNILCCPMRRHGRIIYRLRTTRSRFHRELITKRLIQIILLNLIAAALFSLMNLDLIIQFFSDFVYMRNHPGCSKELSQVYQSGNTGGYIWSPVAPVTWHRIIVLVSDLSEFIFNLSSFTVIVNIMPILAYLVHIDILEYWRSSHSKLIEICWAACREYGQYCCYQYDSVDIRPNETALEFNVAARDFLSRLIMDNGMPMYPRDKAPSQKHPVGRSRRRRLNNAIWDLQCEWCNLNHSIKLANVYMSDCLTMNCILWLVFASCYSYLARRQHSLLAFHLIVNIAFALSLTSYVALMLNMSSLNKGLVQSYKYICTLMAYDQGLHKLRFTKMIDFYLQVGGPGYTMFSTLPITLLTCLSVIGWTVSGAFLMNNIFTYNTMK